MLCRCLTSSYLKQNRNDFEPFLTLHATIDQFCSQEVDPMWKEADEMQIQALASYFRLPIAIHYLDQSETADGTCNKHEYAFTDGGAPLTTDYCINFLYRPGHFELLYT